MISNRLVKSLVEKIEDNDYIYIEVDEEAIIEKPTIAGYVAKNFYVKRGVILIV